MSKMSEEELLTELRSGAINFDDRAMELIHSYTLTKQLEEVERISKYAGAWMNPSTGERTVNWVNMEVINGRITELQAQLNKSKGE